MQEDLRPETVTRTFDSSLITIADNVAIVRAILCPGSGVSGPESERERPGEPGARVLTLTPRYNVSDLSGVKIKKSNIDIMCIECSLYTIYVKIDIFQQSCKNDLNPTALA